MNQQNLSSLIWSVADLLRGDHIAKITRLFGEAAEVWIDKKTGKRVGREALAAGSSASSNGKPRTPAASAVPLTAKPISRIFKTSGELSQ